MEDPVYTMDKFIGEGVMFKCKVIHDHLRNLGLNHDFSRFVNLHNTSHNQTGEQVNA